MRFLANEYFPRAAVEALRTGGHDVAWVRTVSPGATDEQVLERARAEDRVLLTFDKDFGDLVLHRGLVSSPGVVLFRIPLTGPDDVARRVTKALEARADWSGHFSVVGPESTRMRPLSRRPLI